MRVARCADAVGTDSDADDGSVRRSRCVRAVLVMSFRTKHVVVVLSFCALLCCSKGGGFGSKARESTGGRHDKVREDTMCRICSSTARTNRVAYLWKGVKEMASDW